MVLSGKDYATVFLLGAGATRGALKHVLVNRKRIKPPLNSDFFKVAATYARARGTGSADGKRVARLKKVFKEEIPFKGVPTMEEAFSLLYVAKDFPEIYKAGPGRKPSAGNRKEIKDFLRMTFSILSLIDKKSDDHTGYDRLAGKLTQRDTIISLNYDTLLDSALARYGWSPKTGYALGGGQRKVEWKPQQGAAAASLRDVRLLKLHGSMNWYVHGNYTDLSKVFGAKPVLVTGPRRNEVDGHIRQIVPPIYGKIFEHNHWRPLWSRAFQALCKAEALVVIGCSLIDTDFHLRAMLSRVVKYRKKDGSLFKHAIFVAGTKVRRKWQKALRGSYKSTTGYPKFEQFLRKELRI